VAYFKAMPGSWLEELRIPIKQQTLMETPAGTTTHARQSFCHCANPPSPLGSCCKVYAETTIMTGQN